MKTLLVLLFPLVTSAQSLPTCKTFEAQVRGLVTETEITIKDDKKVCKFRMQIGNWFRESLFCPLYQSEVEAAAIEDKDCETKVGEEVSGVIVMDAKTQQAHLVR